MNPELETALRITQNIHSSNPFVLKIPANSTSQDQIHLSTSCFILKKLALVDISLSRQTADLYKQCLLNVVQNPLIDIKCKQTLEEILYFIEYWQFRMKKAASWPHTRTCFYFLQEKLKKAKLFQQLDMVRLKRAQLEPNKKQFLTQIMAESIHSPKLKEYIDYLKQEQQEGSQFSLKKSKILVKQENIMEQKNNDPFEINRLKNILYLDRYEDWKIFQKAIKCILQQKNQAVTQNSKKQKEQQLMDIIETYLFEKLPIFINQIKIDNPKQIVLNQLSFRKSIIQQLAPLQLCQILNLTIAKIKYNQN